MMEDVKDDDLVYIAATPDLKPTGSLQIADVDIDNFEFPDVNQRNSLDFGNLSDGAEECARENRREASS